MAAKDKSYVVAPARLDGSVRGGNFSCTHSGQQVDLMAGATVGKDAYLAGETIHISGTVSGTVRAAGGNITVGENAVIEGDLISYGSKPILEEGATVRGRQEHRADQELQGPQRNPVNSWVRSTLAMLVIVLLITWLMPQRAKTILDRVQETPARNILTGAVWLILVWPVSIILAVTLIGLPLGLVLLATTLVAYIIAAGLAALFIGRWAYSRLSPSASAAQPLSWIAAVLGAVIYEGVQLLGFLGWVATLIVVLFTFGAILQTLWRSRA